MALFDKICIIGYGLIGSSLGRAILENGLANKLICADNSQEVCDKVLELGIADEATIILEDAVQEADIVVLAVPVGACGEVAARISRFLKEGAVVTDTGSVKASVLEAVSRHIPDHCVFVPAHPIAGTENSGPESGFSGLFPGRWCILTPGPDTPIRAVEKVKHLWEACGCTIEIMDIKHHDLVLGITSHLPHLIAYTIVGTATDLEEDIKDEVIKFSAGGFRDFTRIAASDPVMWRDVFINNKEAVLEVLQRFTEDLTELQKAIRRGNGDFLFHRFTETRDIRRAIVDAHQADYRSASGLRSDVPQVQGPDKDSCSES
jgi:cyclohexadieny/prephenate dehydrogenase